MSDRAVTTPAIEVPGHERGYQQDFSYSFFESKAVHMVEDGAGNTALAESRSCEHAADVSGIGIGINQITPTGGLMVDLGEKGAAALRAGQFRGKGFEIGKGGIDKIHLPGIAHQIDG